MLLSKNLAIVNIFYSLQVVVIVKKCYSPKNLAIVNIFYSLETVAIVNRRYSLETVAIVNRCYSLETVAIATVVVSPADSDGEVPVDLPPSVSLGPGVA